jgi:hypothetical protein
MYLASHLSSMAKNKREKPYRSKNEIRIDFSFEINQYLQIIDKCWIEIPWSKII